MKRVLVYLLFSLWIIACSSGASSNITNSSFNNIPLSYQCLPSIPPAINSLPANDGLKIAHANNCSISGAIESTSLQQLAISLQYYNILDNSFNSYCTATPIQYNPQTGVGFIVTAAHCVIGTQTKPANTVISNSDVNTFRVYSGHNSAWVYQNSPARSLQISDLSGEVVAVYVPTKYCKIPTIEANGGMYICEDPSLQDGDIAVLKIKNTNNNILKVNPEVKLAPANYSINSDSYLLGIGYGLNTSLNPSNTVLYYTNYQYFGTNSYMGESGLATIMNGYFYNNAYYSIICSGDSGGGDFAWDGTNWNLIGIHSYGPSPCGVKGKTYGKANDVSADERVYNNWINNILTQDTQANGCANLGNDYVCESGVGQ